MNNIIKSAITFSVAAVALAHPIVSVQGRDVLKVEGVGRYETS